MVKLIHATHGLYIGTEKFCLFGTELVDAYRVHINEEVTFGPIGFGLADVTEIKIKQSDIIFKENVTHDIKDEYNTAVEKDA